VKPIINHLFRSKGLKRIFFIRAQPFVKGSEYEMFIIVWD